MQIIALGTKALDISRPVVDPWCRVQRFHFFNQCSTDANLFAEDCPASQ